MPTKKLFDFTLLMILGVNAALILPRMAARRWVREETGLQRMAGEVVQIGLGK